jgi:hypothetical protein
MARRLRPEANSLYGTPQPLTNLELIPIRFHRAPTPNDTGYPIAQLVYDDVGKVQYVLTSVEGGAATWTAITSAAGTVFTVTGTAGGPQGPTAVGDIEILGDGENITTDSSVANTVSVVLTDTPVFASVESGAYQVTTGGAADTVGLATLVPAVDGGTVTVNTTAVTNNSLIFTSIQTLGGAATPQATSIENVVAGTSFDITSADADDSSTVAWFIVEPV